MTPSPRRPFPRHNVSHLLGPIALGLLALPAQVRAQPPSSAESPASSLTKSQPADTTQSLRLSPGTYLPVALYHTLKAGATAPGTPIQAFTTQRIPVAPGRYLPRGVALSGTVLRSTATPAGTAITLRFTTLRYGGHDTPIRTAALAIANFTNVDDTYAPMTVTGDPSDTSRANWTTMQVGGDTVIRSGWTGPVVNERTQRVGFATFHGVYADPPSSPTATEHPTTLPLALGAFSSTASGLYGFDHDATLATGDGDITVTAPGHLELHANDNLLLKTYDPAAPTTLAAATKPAATSARPAPITQPDEMTPTAAALSTQAPSSPKP